jgi:hypothetical protein
MRAHSCIGFVLLGLTLVSSVAADPPRHLWDRWWNRTSECPPIRCCPDDYVHKPMPCVPTIRCYDPDDYCRKPMPCVPTIRCCGPDDYCRKTLPCLLCPPLTPYLQCVTSDDQCAVCGKRRR